MSTSVFPGERPDRMEEECAVFGVFAPGEDVARMTCFGLQALQHRGQESAGIAVGDGETVTDQTPLGGAIVPNNAEIILYLGAEKSTELCIVPNVVGDSAATANQKIVNAGLIMGVSGATNASSSTVRAISQSVDPGTEVEAGTVVRVQFSDSSVRD